MFLSTRSLPQLELTQKHPFISLLVAAWSTTFPALSLTVSAVAIMIFSGYILYDISQIVHGGETNYISATLKVYLDVYNIFVNLLNLLMLLSGRRD